jgi:hypothetical protein
LQIHAVIFERGRFWSRPRNGPLRGPRFLGDTLMETIRPEKSDPIPLRSTSPPVGTIMIRFVGLLIVVIAAMALIWSR